MDGTGLVHLRARYYAPRQGRFVSRDVWEGDYNRPLSLNRWNYVEGNPKNYTDPSGNYPIDDEPGYDPSWHCYFIDDMHARDACLMRYCKEPLLPWRRDDRYNESVDAILHWEAMSTDQSGTSIIDNTKRGDNASDVWKWICEESGSWSKAICNMQMLGAWILEHEQGFLQRDAVYYADTNKNGAESERILREVVEFIQGDLERNRTNALARQTSFFNPVPDGVFNSSDWDKLMTLPDAVAQAQTERNWNKDYWEYRFRNQLIWWKPDEPEFAGEVPDYTLYDAGGMVIQYYAVKPRP